MKTRHGFRPLFDEESTRIVLVENGGIPFRIAQLAAVEEVRGVMGDIIEGDVGGRLDEDANAIEHLEKCAAALEAITEADVGGGTLELDAQRQTVLQALVREGEEAGYIEIGHESPRLCEHAQLYLQGGDVDLERLLEIAREEGCDTFLRELDAVTALTP